MVSKKGNRSIELKIVESHVVKSVYTERQRTGMSREEYRQDGELIAQFLYDNLSWVMLNFLMIKLSDLVNMSDEQLRRILSVEEK